MDWKKRAAKLISNILNPFLVSAIMMVLLSFSSTSSTFDAIRWSLLLIAVSVLPVFVVVVYLANRKQLDGIFVNTRRQRYKIYLLASTCAVIGCVILYYLGTPPVLMAAFVAGLSAIIVFMCINLLWKISVHSGFVAASVTVLTLLYGATGAVTAVLLPLIIWSRVKLEHHSPAQVTIGAFLAAIIVIAVFYLFEVIPLPRL
ncbi:hypothetical protein ACFLUO_06400 [Chloroflexota bacterium]